MADREGAVMSSGARASFVTSASQGGRRARLAHRRGGLYDRVVDAIGEQIVNGAIPVGTTLFVDQICADLDISRSVVREGVRTLSSMGLVESRPQRGTRVLPRQEWDLLHPRVVHWRGEGPEYLQQMYELLELRFGIEHAAAHFAATRMGTEERTAVVAAGRIMEEAYAQHDPHRFFDADAELHRLILEGSGNPLIAQFADTVMTSLNIRGTAASRSYSTAQSLDSESARRHRELAEAVAAGEPEAAQQASAEIMFATRAEISGLLARRKSPGSPTPA